MGFVRRMSRLLGGGLAYLRQAYVAGLLLGVASVAMSCKSQKSSAPP